MNATAQKPVTVRINPYQVELWVPDGLLTVLTPDEVQTLVVTLVAAVKTITHSRPVHDVVH